MKMNYKFKKALTVVISAMLFIGILAADVCAVAAAALSKEYEVIEPVFGNYFTADYKTKTEAMKAADDLNVEICEEGFVLLKNEEAALPLAENAKVSLFGKNSGNIFYGLISNYVHLRIPDEETKITVAESLELAGMEVNPTLVNFYKDNTKSGSGRGSMPTNGTYVRGVKVGETPVENYANYPELEESYENYSDAAIVVISRSGGEGWDPPTTMKADSKGTPIDGARSADDHYFQLDQNETDLIKYVGDRFEKVIVVFNTPNQFECGFLDDPGHYAYHENIVGAIWIGYPGKTGIKALGTIINGKTNPSAKTVDTWARDFKLDPTFDNFGTFHDRGNSYKGGGGSYVIYQEGIYIGYRYYETRGFEEGYNGNYLTDGSAAKPNIHGTTTTEWDSWYESNVVYPFGYGLSYTTFSQEIVEVSKANNSNITSKDSITVKVKVTNTGSVAGKETAQLFLTPPYYEGGIEKAHVVYAAYAKTGMLQPGDSEVVEMTVNVDDFKSYDYNDANGNGFKGYELEAGTYELKLMSDAHNTIETLTYFVKEGENLLKDSATGTDVVNQFDDVSNYLTDDLGEKYMSRADFVGTFPVAHVGVASTPELRNQISLWSWSNKPTQDWINAQHYVDDVTAFPILDDAGNIVFGSDTGSIKLKDLFRRDYDDPMWDQFMLQLSADTLKHLVADGGYRSGWNVPALGITRVVNAGQPAGYMTLFSGMGSPVDGNYAFFSSDVVTASTHNNELAFRKGVAIGNEALFGEGKNSNSASARFPGWYAPAADTHRSPFGGRNADYYSEDGMIAGKMASEIIKGAMTKGVFCFLKHFAINDQEYTRVKLCTWANEQSMREIYFKPFELAVKEGGTTAIMSALNRIGTTWTGGSYELLTNVLRKEWGFHGMVVTDSHIASYSYTDQMVYAGGDIQLGNAMGEFNRSETKLTTPEGWKAIYRAAKNVLYTMANSMAINEGYAAPPSIFKGEIANGMIPSGAVDFDYMVDISTIEFNADTFTMQGMQIPDINEIVYTLKEGSTLPEGLTLMPNGIIKGTPTKEATNHEFTVVASYSVGGISESREGTMNITIASSTGAIVYDAGGNIGVFPVNEKLSVSLGSASIFKPGSNGEGLPEVTYTVSHKTPLPEGLRLSSDGTLSGIPVKVCDDYSIIIEASALGFKTVECKFTISVNDYGIRFDSSDLAIARIAKPYYASIATAYGKDNITYALKEGSTLPAGLILTSSGNIVGTPSEVATEHSFTVVASAPYCVDKEVEFVISVGLSFSNVELVSVRRGEGYNTSVNMANGAANIVYKLKDGDVMPDGLTLAEDGTISGTPTKAGIYVFTVMATADGAIGDEVTLTLYVANSDIIIEDVEEEGAEDMNQGNPPPVDRKTAVTISIITVVVLGLTTVFIVIKKTL